MGILSADFYLGEDVTRIARSLLGKVLYTKHKGELTAGIIVETEAYCGAIDRASHAYPSRLTRRNSVMFGEGGHAYVYLIYGIHYLFNIVTNRKGRADAVLIRALEPIKGIDIMLARRQKKELSRITSGPGMLSKAMGIDRDLYGLSVLGGRVWVEDQGFSPGPGEIVATTRVGVDYAAEDALLPWRFYLVNNPWISER